MWDYEKVGAPFKEGEYTYFYRNEGLQNQYVLYRTSKEGETEVFLDPNTFSEDGTTSLSSIGFSQDGSLAAYSISEAGSDWRKIIVIDAVTRETIEEPIVDFHCRIRCTKSSELKLSPQGKRRLGMVHTDEDEFAGGGLYSITLQNI